VAIRSKFDGVFCELDLPLKKFLARKLKTPKLSEIIAIRFSHQIFSMSQETE